MSICERCNRKAKLSAKPEAGVTFNEPLCEKCRQEVIRGLNEDSFDRDYARAIANGWSD